MIQTIIIEDETILRQGIISLIDWNSMGCEIIGDFSNGIAALEFAEKHKIDLIVTDIQMPLLNGLELAKTIKELSPSTKIIILTAYADFEYTKTAIQLNISDYVLKSNFVNELPEAIIRVKNMIEKEQEESGRQPDASSDSLKYIIAAGILDNAILDPKEIKNWAANFLEPFTDYYVLQAEIHSLDFSSFTNTDEPTLHAITNFFCLAFKNYHFLSFWLAKHSYAIIVCFNQSTESDNLKKLVITCNKILSTVNEHMNFHVNIGISGQHKDITELKNAHKEALDSLSYTYHNDNLSIYVSDTDKKPFSPACIDIEFLSNQFFLGVTERKIKETELIFNNIILEIRKEQFELEQVKIMALLITSSFFRKLNKNMPLTNIELIERSITKQVLCCHSLHSVFMVIKNILKDSETWEFSTFASPNHLVNQVNEYITQNYKKPIKVSEIANCLHINSSYISRLYKKITNDSIINALNKYRISKAKDLLKNNNYMVWEIGSMVGIEDPAYFTMVFTKYEGVSPTVYRNLNY